MLVDRLPWQPGRTLIWDELADYLDFGTRKIKRECLKRADGGASKLLMFTQHAKGYVDISVAVTDTHIARMVASANGCTGGTQ